LAVCTADCIVTGGQGFFKQTAGKPDKIRKIGPVMVWLNAISLPDTTSTIQWRNEVNSADTPFWLPHDTLRVSLGLCA
jgi:hypothetical protein